MELMRQEAVGLERIRVASLVALERQELDLIHARQGQVASAMAAATASPPPGTPVAALFPLCVGGEWGGTHSWCKRAWRFWFGQAATITTYVLSLLVPLSVSVHPVTSLAGHGVSQNPHASFAAVAHDVAQMSTASHAFGSRSGGHAGGADLGASIPSHGHRSFHDAGQAVVRMQQGASAFGTHAGNANEAASHGHRSFHDAGQAVVRMQQGASAFGSSGRDNGGGGGGGAPSFKATARKIQLAAKVKDALMAAAHPVPHEEHLWDALDGVGESSSLLFFVGRFLGWSCHVGRCDCSRDLS